MQLSTNDTNNSILYYDVLNSSHQDYLEPAISDVETNKLSAPELSKESKYQSEVIKNLYLDIVCEYVSKNFDYSTNEDPLQSDVLKTVRSRLNRVLDKASKLVKEKNPNILMGDAFFEFIKNGFLKVAEKITTCEIIQKIPNKHVKGHFYKIEDSEGTIRGYLLGTIHIIHSSIMDMNEEIKLAIAKADHLFIECNEDISLLTKENERQNYQILNIQPEKKLKKALQAYINILSSYPLKNTTWPELEKEIKILNTIDALQLCIKHYANICANAIGAVDCSNSRIIGIDGWLRHQFVKAEKSILGFESLEIQSKIFDEILFPKYQKELTMGLLKPNVTATEQFAIETSNEWSRGDSEHPSHQEGTNEYKIFEERSMKFEEVIFQDIKLNKIGFYGFGENHLYDSKGVIKGLQSRNLKIIRI